MPYSGAFAAARSSRSRRSVSLSSGAGEVRVATGSPNSAKKRSRPAGATVHSSRASSPAVLRKAWGALAGMLTESPTPNRRGGRSRSWSSIEPAKTEALLERVPVRGRPATRRDEHVEHREAAGGLLSREQHGVGVADNREVQERLVVGTCDRKLAGRIIGRQRRGGAHWRVVNVVLSCQESNDPAS